MISYLFGVIFYGTFNYIRTRYVGKSIIHEEIGDIAARYPNILAQTLYILIVVGGLYIFVSTTGWLLAAIYGSVFGLVTYGAHHMLNKSILIQWAWKLILFDIVWGAIICGLTSMVMFFLG